MFDAPPPILRACDFPGSPQLSREESLDSKTKPSPSVCLPAFSPNNVHREEGEPAPPPHDKHFDIYHLVQEHIWEVRGQTLNPKPRTLNPKPYHLVQEHIWEVRGPPRIWPVAPLAVQGALPLGAS